MHTSTTQQENTTKKGKFVDNRIKTLEGCNMTKFINIETVDFNRPDIKFASLNVDEISSVTFQESLGEVFAEVVMKSTGLKLTFSTIKDVEAVAKAVGRDRVPSLKDFRPS